MKEEFILCSAIHFTNNFKCSTVKNIESGVIICGRRHSDCFNILEGIVGNLNTIKSSNLKVHGFLTSKNRFVLRDEAFIIAQQSKQFLNSEYNTIDPFGMQLISEHIF